MTITNWGCDFKNIKAQWDKKVVLNQANLSLDLKTDPYIPLCGITGGGKTTAMHLMSSQKKPHGGKITWRFPDGTVFEWTSSQPLSARQITLLRCNYFGMAFQDSILLPHLKINENFIYRLTMRPRTGIIDQEKINQALKSVLVTKDEKKHSIDYWLNKFPHELSGGQRQRFSLAQAMIRDPYVLFADEPTGSLDRKAREDVMQVLWDWVEAKKGQRALIWITHHMEYPDDPDMKKATERYYFTEDGQFEKQSYVKEQTKWLNI